LAFLLADPRGGKTEGPCSSSNRIAHRARCCAYGSIDIYCRPLKAESLLSIPQSRVAARSCTFLMSVQSTMPSSRQPRQLMA
jgi:hypothetical protein